MQLGHGTWVGGRGGRGASPPHLVVLSSRSAVSASHPYLSSSEGLVLAGRMGWLPLAAVETSMKTQWRPHVLLLPTLHVLLLPPLVLLLPATLCRAVGVAGTCCSRRHHRRFRLRRCWMGAEFSPEPQLSRGHPAGWAARVTWRHGSVEPLVQGMMSPCLCRATPLPLRQRSP